MKNDTKYIAYYRVSTARQGRSGLGLEAQQEQVKRFVNCNDCIIADYTDVESGQKSDRPQLKEALKHAKESGATVVIAKLDRLSRDVEFIFSLINNKIKIKCADMPDFNTLTLGIFASLAQYERELISSRTKAAFAAKKARGEKKRSGNNLTPEVIAAGSKALKENADKDEHNLRAWPLIEALRKEGKTYREIADKLNLSKYTTKNGKPYSASTVFRIEKRYTQN